MSEETKAVSETLPSLSNASLFYHQVGTSLSRSQEDYHLKAQSEILPVVE